MWSCDFWNEISKKGKVFQAFLYPIKNRVNTLFHRFSASLFLMLTLDFWSKNLESFFHYFLKGKKKTKFDSRFTAWIWSSSGRNFRRWRINAAWSDDFWQNLVKRSNFRAIFGNFFLPEKIRLFWVFFSPVLELTCQVKNTRALSFSLVAHTHTR